MVKIAHHYNYNAPACTMSSLDVSDVLFETDASGEEEGVDPAQTTTSAAGDGAASSGNSLEDNKHNAADGGSEDGGKGNNKPNGHHHHLGSNNDNKPSPSDEQPRTLQASTTMPTAVLVPVVDERRRGRTSSTASTSASPMTPVNAVDVIDGGGGGADSGGSISTNISSGSSPRPPEGSGNGRQQQPPPWSLAAPVQSSSRSKYTGWGDDRHVVETQPDVRPTVQGNNIATGVGGGGRRGPEWASTVRELTRLWVRAVGSLCCPSHSELWVPMIDAGMIGALNR